MFKKGHKHSEKTKEKLVKHIKENLLVKKALFMVNIILKKQNKK